MTTAPSSPPSSSSSSTAILTNPVVLSILLTEAAERFSYFGFRAILVLYLHHSLKYDESTAIALFAYASCLAYGSPLLGAVVSDAYLGRYRTILRFGLCYAVGLIVLTIGAYLPEAAVVADRDGATDDRGGGGEGGGGRDETGDDGGGEGYDSLPWKRLCTFVGLLLACVGTGGIKPCVSAFGADQVAAAKSSASAPLASASSSAPDGGEGDGVKGKGESAVGRDEDGRRPRRSKNPEPHDRSAAAGAAAGNRTAASAAAATTDYNSGLLAESTLGTDVEEFFRVTHKLGNGNGNGRRGVGVSDHSDPSPGPPDTSSFSVHIPASDAGLEGAGAAVDGTDVSTDGNDGGDGGEHDEDVRAFFAAFYFCVNVGALASMGLIPLVRGAFGFGAAFLCPTLFLLGATINFVSRKGEYVIHEPHSSEPSSSSESRDGGGGRNDEDGGLAKTFAALLHLLAEEATRFVPHRLLPRRRPRSSRGGGGRYRRVPAPAAAIEMSSVSSNGVGIAPSSAPATEFELVDDHGGAARAGWGDGTGATATSGGDGPSPFTRQQLDDASRVLRVLPVLSLLPAFWMLYDQQGSVWTLQASRMELHGLQPEQLGIINPVEIMLLLPLFERCVYPSLERRGWKITHLRRMGCGMLFASLSFVIAGLLESFLQRRESIGSSPPSVLWQLPQISILAIAEILLSVTGLEFAYAHSPARLKALIMAAYLLTTATGDLLGGMLYSTVFRSADRATTMHACAFLMLCNLALFWRVARWWEASSGDDNICDDDGGAASALEHVNECGQGSLPSPTVTCTTCSRHNDHHSVLRGRSSSQSQESSIESVGRASSTLSY